MLAITKSSVLSIILTSPLKCAIAGFNCSLAVIFVFKFRLNFLYEKCNYPSLLKHLMN